jgi:hypothetical protein
VTKHRIGLTHPLQDGDRPDPEADSENDAPQCCEAESEADGNEQRDKHQFAITAENLVRAVRRLVNHDLAGPVGSHGYTTAAFTPKALASIGAAKTRTDTTRPTMQARLPNSVNSPPQSIVPPAIAIPINPIAYATGPVNDVAIVCIGRSHGRFPAAAACKRMLHAHINVIKVASREARAERFQFAIRFMLDSFFWFF